VVYCKGDRLKVKAMWDGYWRIINPNQTAVSYTWKTLNGNESGSGQIGVKEVLFFETSIGHQTIQLFVDGILHDMVAWNPEPKLKIENSVVVPDENPLHLVNSIALSEERTETPTSESNVLMWGGAPGQIYHLFRRTNLVHGTWEKVPGGVCTGQNNVITYTNSMAGENCMFYKVDVEITSPD